MKEITLTIKQIWALKIIFSSVVNALEKGTDGNYYVNNNKFFLALNQKERNSLRQIANKI